MNKSEGSSECGAATLEEFDVASLYQWISNGRVFVLLDACDEPLIPPKVKSLGSRAVSLYHGEAQYKFEHIAPYLAELDLELSNWVVEKLANTPWGYFLLTNDDCSLLELRKHFRKFLLVRLPDGKQVYFRFYDPRLITPFIHATCCDEIRSFFGPIRKIAILDSSCSQINVIKRPED